MENLNFRNQKSPKILNRFLLNFLKILNLNTTGFIYRKCKCSFFQNLQFPSILFESTGNERKFKRIDKPELCIPRGHTINSLIVSNLLALPGECKGNESKGNTS